jgi:hypothetical protein
MLLVTRAGNCCFVKWLEFCRNRFGDWPSGPECGPGLQQRRSMSQAYVGLRGNDFETAIVGHLKAGGILMEFVPCGLRPICGSQILFLSGQ